MDALHLMAVHWMLGIGWSWRWKIRVDTKRPAPSRWKCHLDRTIYIQVCLFQLVHHDDHCLFPNINIESLGSTLEDLQGVFREFFAGACSGCLDG